jgi:hypothetical protein
MTKYFLILTLMLLLLGCKKDKVSQKNSDNVKIELISGNNQTAAIGYYLADSIVVKVTLNGAPAVNYDVQFIGSGCNEDMVTDLHTNGAGSVTYYWSLSEQLGPQILRAVVIDGPNRIDSVKVAANAVNASDKFLQPKSACAPANTQRILQLSTGRLIACFTDLETGLRYSDDDGQSWHALKGFNLSKVVLSIAATPNDELFAATEDKGIFYSKDAGNTWVDITPSSYNKQEFPTEITYTPSGKLLITGNPNNTFISTDKGKTWKLTNNGIEPTWSLYNPSEAKNGDLYMVSKQDALYKSTDGGNSWAVQNSPAESVTAIYCASDGGIYKAGASAIYLSKDNGLTFNTYLTFNIGFPYIQEMTIQPDGSLYFLESDAVIGRFSPPSTINNEYAQTYDFSGYILTKNNVFVYGTIQGLYYK